MSPRSASAAKRRPVAQPRFIKISAAGQSLHDSVKDACATIDRLHREREELRRTLSDLLEQVDSLDGYELTRDIEPYKAEANWDDALYRARMALERTR